MIFLGACGLLFALFVGSNVKGVDGFTTFVVVVSALFLGCGFIIVQRSQKTNSRLLRLLGVDVGCVLVVVTSGKNKGEVLARIRKRSFLVERRAGFAAVELGRGA